MPTYLPRRLSARAPSPPDAGRPRFNAISTPYKSSLRSVANSVTCACTTAAWPAVRAPA
ncbi:hypothetical protein SGPA1_10601 [Streptomyces misionensis JCM 4497]